MVNIKLMKLYFVTENADKFSEIKNMLPTVEQLNVELTEIQSIYPEEVIEAKLNEAFRFTSGSFIVEDTSLYFDCLNGLPGPLVKWFLEAIGNEGLYELAKKYNNFNATAITYLGYAENKNNIHFFNGVLRGNIVEPKVRTDFGWDSIFQPEGFSKCFAEMDPTEKNRISMRRIALNKLNDFISQ